MPPRAAFTITAEGLHSASCSAPIRPAVSGRLRQVDRDEVGLGHELVERHQPDPQLAPRGRHLHERVVRDDGHTEGAQPLRHQHPDLAEADDAQGLLEQLDAGVLAALPLAAAQGGARRRDVASGGQQQADGELGGADDVRGAGSD